MQWLNEPPAWRDEQGELSVVTGEKTDFWRETHYGFIRNDGHFRFREVRGDFSAEIAFAGEYRELYDQAGLMLRLNERNWLKAGIEFVAGRQMLSAVATRDASDWSTAAAPADAAWMRLRLVRQGSAVRVEWALPGPQPSYQLMRLAYLPAAESVQVGPMCCSPQRAGFSVRFRDFAVSAGAAGALHG